LDEATRIGLGGAKKWRVVTLQGGLIDNSGTMSGGGQTVAKGGMRASFCQYSPDEVKSIVEDYEKSHAQLATLRHEQRQLQEALDLTQKEISEFELREAKCEMDVKSLKKQMDAYEERLKSMKVPTLSSGEKSKLKELEKMIASKSDELNRIYSEHHALENEVRELHNQIMNIGGEELKTAKAKVDEATKKCEDMRKLIKKSLLDADLMDKNSKKAEASAQSAKEEHGNVEKALKLLREEHAKLDDKAETVLNSYNKLKESLAVKDKTLTELRQKRDDVINAASAHKNQEVDLVHEMEEKTRTLRDLQARKTGWGNKLEEARKEYGQLPLGILDELRQAQRGPDGETDAVGVQDLARKAITTDLPEADLLRVVRADADARLLVLDQNLKNLKPNLASIEEFKRADAEHKSKLSDYEAVHTEREDARRLLEGLRQQRLEEFMDGFSVISMKLKEMYQMITLGGDAELELVDTLDPFSEGINFSVRPPKKSWKQITNLSGGEKTLASLSLVFALHHYKPTPLYFMDEIDAALDFRNVSIIANYIKERTKNAQFIVISLRNHMFELADLLVGIYKTYDVSKSVAIDPLVFERKNALQDKDTNVEPVRALAAGKRPPEPIEGPPATARRLQGKENSVS
jgi:structural maintenance of chromosome 4